MSETNPFRQSMIQRRSQSPLDDPFASLNNYQTRPTPQFESSAGTTGANPSINISQASSENPFESSRDSHSRRAPPLRGVTLSDGPSQPPSADSGYALEPPSYRESEGRRHSAPHISADDEKQRLAMTDDKYREGYEEGMRIARERERQRRREAREAREARRRDGSGSGRPELGDRRASDPRRGSPPHHHHHSSSSRRMRSKSESAGGSQRHRHASRPKNASLDVIDKMDVTGLYGGSGFHHDGPFDACTPHRNKASVRGATPISAFPADGPNNSLAVEDSSLAAFRKEESVYGRQVEAPIENSFDPTDRGAKVHGQRSAGLGSSTFIDGTPASRDAIAQAGRERSESLGRSRSLLRRQLSTGGRRLDSPEDDGEPKSLLGRVRSLRVGRH